jgi:hypothetical protein
MEDDNNDFVMAKDPKVFDDYLTKIQDEFEKQRGFRPPKTDIKRNMVKQFVGKFIV